MPEREMPAVVIVAAGSSRRFGADKMSEKLGDRTVLEAAVEALRSAAPAASMVVVVAADRVEYWRTTLSSCEVVGGGPRRQDSVRIGVEWAAERGAEVVVVHDAARPLIHPRDASAVIEAMGDASAAILCARVCDTVKRIDGEAIVRETVDRDSLRLAQTPQVFRVAALESAWQRQDLSREWSDEAALIEADGGLVRSTVAEHPNPKITTTADLEMVRLLGGAGS